MDSELEHPCKRYTQSFSNSTRHQIVTPIRLCIPVASVLIKIYCTSQSGKNSVYHISGAKCCFHIYLDNSCVLDIIIMGTVAIESQGYTG